MGVTIKGFKIQGFKLAARDLSGITGAYFWFSPGRGVTMPVGNRISKIVDTVGGVEMVMNTEVQRPELAYRNSVPYVYNLSARLLESTSTANLAMLHSGADWCMLLSANTYHLATTRPYIFGNTTISGANAGFAIAVDNRQNGANRTNALEIFLADGTAALFSANLGDNSYPQNTDVVLELRYRRNAANSHTLTVIVRTKANPAGTSYTVNSTATAAVTPPATASYVTRIFRAASGSYTTGYIGDIYIMQENGKTQAEKDADRQMARDYFFARHLN